MKQDWEIKEFEDCLEKVVYTNKIQRKDFLEVGEYPIISQEQDFINGYWDNSDDLFKVKKPIVIFGDHTQVFKYVDFDFVLGADGVKILQPKNNIDSRFLYYFLQNINLGSLGYARHYRLLKKIEVSYPSLPEQHRIVAILDKAFAVIDKAKANIERNLQNSRELFQSRLNQIFSDRGGHAETHEVWSEKRFCEIYDVRDGTHDSPKYYSTGFPLVTSKNLKNGLISFDKINYISKTDYDLINKRSKVDVGDVLFAMIGTIGNPVVIIDEPNFAIKNVALFKVPPTQSSKFLKYYLQSNFVVNKMEKESKGTTQKFVGLGYLRNFIIFIPGLVVQQSIVGELDRLYNKTKSLEIKYQQKLNILEELKNSILQKAFNGELK